MKGPFSDPFLTKNVISRSSTILPQYLGQSFAVYNGKEFKTFGSITIDHIGKKFGEFSPTKKPAVYKRKKK